MCVRVCLCVYEGCFVHPDGRIQYGSFQHDRQLSLLQDKEIETEAVAVQYRLNLTELLSTLPSIGSSPSQQTLDLERLVLRYNTSVRALLQKYASAAAEYSALRRSLEKQSLSGKREKDLHRSMSAPPSWSHIDHLFHSRREIHTKFFTICMQQLCQFARECDIIGPTMTSHDICMCVKRMHVENT